jgi:hypothetical protein
MHYHEFDYETQNLLADKYLFLCHIRDPQWTIVNTKEWISQRVHESQISKGITNPYRSLQDFMSMYTSCIDFDGTLDFVEQSQYTADF